MCACNQVCWGPPTLLLRSCWALAGYLLRLLYHLLLLLLAASVRHASSPSAANSVVSLILCSLKSISTATGRVSNCHWAHWQRGELEAGSWALLRATELSPHFADAYRNAGSAYFLQGKLEQAAAAYSRAASLAPGDAHRCFTIWAFIHNVCRLIHTVCLHMMP